SVMFILIMWLSTAPKLPGLSAPAQAAQDVAAAAPFINASRFGAAREIVLVSCAVCHTAVPAWPGIRQAPKDVILDNDVAIALNAREIYVQAAKSNAMPPGNVTELSEADRLVLAEWYLEGIGK
ncbi:MAG: cysteine desulfurase, partial [Alphaproteobacteria bacterium]|nr:cysteine desulfurase [Alphaproteobacteria bacterium]